MVSQSESKDAQDRFTAFFKNPWNNPLWVLAFQKKKSDSFKNQTGLKFSGAFSVLCISTSERVLHTLFPCQNQLFDAKTIFSVTNGKKKEKRKQSCTKTSLRGHNTL